MTVLWWRGSLWSKQTREILHHVQGCNNSNAATCSDTSSSNKGTTKFKYIHHSQPPETIVIDTHRPSVVLSLIHVTVWCIKVKFPFNTTTIGTQPPQTTITFARFPPLLQKSSSKLFASRFTSRYQIFNLNTNNKDDHDVEKLWARSPFYSLTYLAQ